MLYLRIQRLIMISFIQAHANVVLENLRIEYYGNISAKVLKDMITRCNIIITYYEMHPLERDTEGNIQFAKMLLNEIARDNPEYKV